VPSAGGEEEHEADSDGDTPGDAGGSDSVAEPEAGRSGSDFVAEPRRFPKPKTCSDYAKAQEILADERAGKLTKDDKLWLDMDGDGRYCEGRGVVWKGERTQAE
jgi:hypothetical protein